MNIEKITKMKSGKYKIVFENKESILTYDDVILKENLLYRKSIDLYTYKKIAGLTSYYDIYHKVIRFISVRYRSKKEVDEYLQKMELEEKEREKMINHLIENHLIDDKRFMQSYINDRLYLSNDGPFLIAKNLKSYGILEDQIKEEIDKIDSKIIYDKLLSQMKKKISCNTKYSKSAFRQKLLSTYKEKGYESSMILDIFDLCYKENGDALLKEYQKIYKKLSLKYSKDELAFRVKQKLYSKGFSSSEINNIISKN